MTNTQRELIEAIRDAIFMLKGIEKARQLPPTAQAQQQYVAAGKQLEEALELWLAEAT